MNGYFCLPEKLTASANDKMCNGTVKKLWSSFTAGESALTLCQSERFVFTIGNAAEPKLCEGSEFAITVTEDGVSVAGDSFGGLMRGFFALLMKIELKGSGYCIKCINEQSNYCMKNRMIHICIFPENDLYYYKKLIRFIALCQYTHIVIEFWGMLRYDCMKELAWPNAFTKAEAAELIAECRELGISPIPMFNQLGHASASRVIYGKHVVLDQNPKLERLFTPDGWAWNIASSEVKALLRAVRRELYELFGDCEYMHIGCDEAFIITEHPQYKDLLRGYISELTGEVEREGKRPMLWMDMLLEKGVFKDCYCAGEKEAAKRLRESTSKSTVFVDWQYDCFDTPIPSLYSLKDCGRDVMGAPWFNEKNYVAHIDTIKQNGLFGIMFTTWHTLRDKMRSVVNCAHKLGASMYDWTGKETYRSQTAVMFRKVSFEGNDYKSSGWAVKQIEI